MTIFSKVLDRLLEPVRPKKGAIERREGIFDPKKRAEALARAAQKDQLERQASARGWSEFSEKGHVEAATAAGLNKHIPQKVDVRGNPPKLVTPDRLREIYVSSTGGTVEMIPEADRKAFESRVNLIDDELPTLKP